MLPRVVRPNLAQQVHGSLPWTFGASGMSGLRAVFGLGWPKASGGHLNVVGAVLAEGQFCWLQGVGSSRCLGTSGSRVKAWRGISGILAAPNSSYHSITALWHSSSHANLTTTLVAKAAPMRGEPVNRVMQLQNPGTTRASPRLAVKLELVRRMHSDEPEIMSSSVALYAPSSSEHLLSAPSGKDPNCLCPVFRTGLQTCSGWVSKAHTSWIPDTRFLKLSHGATLPRAGRHLWPREQDCFLYNPFIMAERGLHMPGGIWHLDLGLHQSQTSQHTTIYSVCVLSLYLLVSTSVRLILSCVWFVLCH